MKHIKEFERFAHEYQNYKIIQSRVAKHLVRNTPFRGKRLLDIGAGSGEVYRNIDWEFEYFVALDSSQKMLGLHPSAKVRKIVCDFDDPRCWQKLESDTFDLIFSSSALQWSKNLEKAFFRIAKTAPFGAFALFTSATFATIHEILGISSPIYDQDAILAFASRHFMVDYEIRRYRLFFEDTAQMFRYIKRSGVSSGRMRAPVGDIRRLLRTYPHRYLEFEVVFLWAKSRYC